VNEETMLAEGTLPLCPRQAGAAKGKLARPNILMFGDYGFVTTRLNQQENNLDKFLDKIPLTANVVVIEIGAGKAIPTVRQFSESILAKHPNAHLLRINPRDSDGPDHWGIEKERVVSIPHGSLEALTLIQQYEL